MKEMGIDIQTLLVLTILSSVSIVNLFTGLPFDIIGR